MLPHIKWYAGAFFCTKNKGGEKIHKIWTYLRKTLLFLNIFYILKICKKECGISKYRHKKGRKANET